MATNNTSGFPYYEYDVTFPDDSFVPVSTTEWQSDELGAVIFGAVSFVPTILAFAVLNYHRNVNFIKILGLQYSNALLVSAILFWLSNLTAVRLAPQTGAFLVCSLWNQWLFVGSITTIVILLLMRLWRLDLILVQRKPAKGPRFYLPPLSLYLGYLALSIACSAVSGDGPYYFPDVNGRPMVMCLMLNAIFFPVLVYLLSIMVLYLIVAYRLRKSRQRIFNEYHQSLVMFGIFIVGIIVYGVIMATRKSYLHWGRAFLVILIAILCNAALWVFGYRPLYNVLFRREAAIAEFQLLINNKRIVVDSYVVHSTQSGGAVRRTVGGLISSIFSFSSQNQSSNGGGAGEMTSQLSLRQVGSAASFPSKSAFSSGTMVDETIVQLTSTTAPHYENDEVDEPRVPSDEPPIDQV